MARSKKAQAAINDALSIDYPANTVGLGIDLVEIDRMRAVLERTPNFAKKCFSLEEVAYCAMSSDPAKNYAARFAAKEAAVKALGTGFSEGVWVRDIEVQNDDNGRPRVILHGRAKEKAESLGIVEMALSMSHTEKDAVAFVIAMTKNAQVPRKKETPAEELARQFKETRGMLDDIGKTMRVDESAREDIGNSDKDADKSSSEGADKSSSEGADNFDRNCC